MRSRPGDDPLLQRNVFRPGYSVTRRSRRRREWSVVPVCHHTLSGTLAAVVCGHRKVGSASRPYGNGCFAGRVTSPLNSANGDRAGRGMLDGHCRGPRLRADTAPQTALPVYFFVYTAVVGASLSVDRRGHVAGVRQPPVCRSWAGCSAHLVSVVFLGVYLASRAVTLPGLVAVTGRWDFQPPGATLAGALALVFCSPSTCRCCWASNVAYPQRQQNGLD